MQFTLLACDLQASEVVLTLRQAVELALRPEVQGRLQNAQLARELAEARVAQARAAGALQVGAAVSQTAFRFDLRASGLDVQQASPFVVNVNIDPVVGPFGVLDSRLTASKPLWSPAMAGQVKAARREVSALEANEGLTKDQIAMDAARAYLTALLAQEAMPWAEAAVRQAAYFVELEQRRKEQGLVTGAEVRRAQLEQLKAEQRLAQARGEQRLAALQLKGLTGIEWQAVLRLTALPAAEARAWTDEEALAQSMATRGELRGMETQLDVLNSTAQAIDAQKLPTLAAFGNFGGLTTAPTPNRTEGSAMSYTYAAGVALRIPVLDGGRRAAQLAEVEARRRSVESNRRMARQQIELQIRAASERLRNAREQVALREKEEALLTADVAQSKERFAAGATTGVEYREAEERLSETRYRRMMAGHEWNVARLALAEAMGTVREFRW